MDTERITELTDRLDIRELLELPGAAPPQRIGGFAAGKGTAARAVRTAAKTVSSNGQSTKSIVCE